VASHGLAAFVDMDVLNGDFLRPFAPVAVQRFEQGCVGPGQFDAMFMLGACSTRLIAAE
jgi:hypothetical protein